MFRYRNYLGKPEVDIETQMIRGRLLNITDRVEFEGMTVEQAEADFRRVVDYYLTRCEEQGREPEKPFSGKLPFRTSPEIHRDIYVAANRADLSINAWMESVLSRAAQQIGADEISESLEFAEPSIAEYQSLLTQLQAKIRLLENAITPYLQPQPGIFEDLLNQIKPILTDKELPSLIERVDQISNRLSSIRSQETLLLPLLESTQALSDLTIGRGSSVIS